MKYILNTTYGNYDYEEATCTKTMFLGVFSTMDLAKDAFANFYKFVKASKLAKSYEDGKDPFYCDGEILQVGENATNKAICFYFADPDWERNVNRKIEVSFAQKNEEELEFDMNIRLGIPLGEWICFSKYNTPYGDVEMRSNEVEQFGYERLGKEIFRAI